MRRLLLLVVALPLLAAPVCQPARPTITLPADQSPLGLVASPNVVIDFAEPLGNDAIVSLQLVTGLDPEFEGVPPVPTLTDLSARLGNLASATQATTDLLPADLRPGRSTLYVNVDHDGDGNAEFAVSSTFSWEPDIDAATADRCDVLDPERCMLPFPSDHYTVEDGTTGSGRRNAFVSASMPTNAGQQPVDPNPYNRLDGFSPGAVILAHIDGVDLAQTGAAPITDLASSLDPDAPIAVIDAETGERWLQWSELSDPIHNILIPEGDLVYTRPGKNFVTGRRYIVAYRWIKDGNGDLMEPSRGFRIYRDAIPTFEPTLEARRPHMEQIFDELWDAGIAREDLFLAFDFTVASADGIAGPVLAMRDDAFEWLGAAAPSFQVTQVEERPFDPHVRRRVRGTFEVPNYMTGTGGIFSLLNRGPDGITPVVNPVNPVYTADFLCSIPRSASQDGGDPVTPARASLYGHGLLGDEGEAGASHVRFFANSHNFVFCGAKWIGLSEDEFDQGVVFQVIDNFSNFPFIPERLHQGMLNFLFLGRLMIHPDGLNSDPAFQAGAADTGIIDGSALFYDGNSQGAINGGGLAAIAQDFTHAVLGVNGMNYSTLLRRSVDFDQFLIFVNATYPNPIDRAMAIALIQMLWDAADTNGHAGHITSDPYPNTPAKKILLHTAWGDFQVANISAEVEARTMGASIHTPALSGGDQIDRGHWDVNPFFGIPPIVYDANGFFDGSAMIYWDSGNATPPNGNVPPRPGAPAELTACALGHGEDPHECPRRQPAARLQKSEFLKIGGAILDVCGNAPCQAPDDL